MFGLGNMKEDNKTNAIVVVNKTEINHFYEEYPIRYIFLTDLQNYKINEVDLYSGFKNVPYVTSSTLRITMYFLFECANGELGFQFNSFTYIISICYFSIIWKFIFSRNNFPFIIKDFINFAISTPLFSLSKFPVKSIFFKLKNSKFSIEFNPLIK